MSKDEEYDELFNLDRLIGELDDMEADIKGKKKVAKKDAEPVEDELPEPIRLEESEERRLDEMEKDVQEYEPPVGEPPVVEDDEECDECFENAKKFVEDRFCSLTDDTEKEEACIMEAMKVVKKVQSGKITMREFEQEIKRLGKKYITDWEDDEENDDIIPEQVKEDLTGDD